MVDSVLSSALGSISHKSIVNVRLLSVKPAEKLSAFPLLAFVEGIVLVNATAGR